jgi:putative transposase
LRGDAHGGCGGRARETDRERSRHRVLVRPLPPTDKIRGAMDALFGSGRDLAEILEDVARLGARLIVHATLGTEVEEFLDRACCQRREASAASS